jgi:hypothetical protein
MNNISPIPNTTPADRFAAFADDNLPPTFVGRTLKHNKGEYIVGKDGEVLPIGTRLVAFMPSLMAGWTRWEGGKPVDPRMGCVYEGYVAPKRYQLGDNNMRDWLGDATTGEVKDPWQKSVWLVFFNPDTKEPYTFLASGSKGSLEAVAKLAREYSKEVRKHPGVVPLVSLGIDFYMHENRAYGKIKYPVFAVVDYVDAKPFAETLATLRGEKPSAPPAKASVISFSSGKPAPEPAPPIDENPHGAFDPIDDEIPF